MAELKPFEVIMRLSPYAPVNSKNEVCFHVEKVSELVRCKDCKWYEPDLYNNSFGVCCHEEWVIAKCGSGVDADGFCYRGERKDEVE